jgi:hypothetical protein
MAFEIPIALTGEIALDQREGHLEAQRGAGSSHVSDLALFGSTQ